MVGDNVETDIMFGKNSKVKTCFVYSGIVTYPPSDKNIKLLEEA
jgi:ribonucleotide monophosphatase NagD (HAD superfamily)